MTKSQRRAVRKWLVERIAEMECDEESIDEEDPHLMSGLRALERELSEPGPKTVPRRGQLSTEMITVCDSCGSEACWKGEFMCEKARGAGTKQVPKAAP